MEIDQGPPTVQEDVRKISRRLNKFFKNIRSPKNKRLVPDIKRLMSESSSSDSEREPARDAREWSDDSDKRDNSYKDATYWALPDNVRTAIDVAKSKAKHSEFYYRLQTLNDKIFVFQHVYYNKMPSFQRAFFERKKRELLTRAEMIKAQRIRANYREMKKEMQKSDDLSPKRLASSLGGPNTVSPLRRRSSTLKRPDRFSKTGRVSRTFSLDISK